MTGADDVGMKGPDADDDPPAATVAEASGGTPATAQRMAVAGYVLALSLLFLMAFGARAIGLGGAVTEDEDQWIARSGAFAHGLASHEWRRTYLTGHPGVTVMWLTTATLGIDRTQPFERANNAPDVTTVPDFLPALLQARVPFAVLQAGLVVVAAVLAGRLLGPAPGLIAGVLLAFEPFWAGVGPVVGMDGLLTGFLTVSLLALLLACGFEQSVTAGESLGAQPFLRKLSACPELAEGTGSGRPGGVAGSGRPGWPRSQVGWAALAGSAFGLAFLSKTTALFAGPVVGGLVLIAGWRGWRSRVEAGGTRRWWLMPVVIGVAWIVSAVLVVWLLWPAAWAAPIGTMVRAITFSARLGGEPHAPGNFLLGEPIDDPGPLFYAVALIVRLGPGTIVGLLLLFALGAGTSARRVVWSLLGYVGLFLLLLMLAPKKVDRYLLPILPTLGVLAAIGWMEAARRLPGILRFPSPLRGGGVRGEGILVVGIVALGLQVWPLVQAGRYPLAGYNPLVGGVRTAEAAIPVGWGDGLDVAGERIRELAGGQPVVTSIWSPLRVSFGAHAPGPVVSHQQIAQADFYVDYVHARQRRLTPRLLAGRQPDAVVTIGGVEYARIYKLR